MNLNILGSGIFVAGGLLFFLIGLIGWLRHKKKKEECTRTIIARVARIDSKVKPRDSDNAGETTVYAPVFEYQVNDRMYIKTHNVYSSKCPYEYNQNVEINYNSSDPNIFYITKDTTTDFIYIILMAGGGVFIVIGVCVMFFFELITSLF